MIHSYLEAQYLSLHVYTHTGVLGPGVNAGGGCWSEVQESGGTGGERLETASDDGEEQEQEESEGTV